MPGLMASSTAQPSAQFPSSRRPALPLPAPLLPASLFQGGLYQPNSWVIQGHPPATSLPYLHLQSPSGQASYRIPGLWAFGMDIGGGTVWAHS